MLFGLFLVLIGTLWLFSNLGYITIPISQIFWPLIVIAIGLMFLLRRVGHHHIKCWFCDSASARPPSRDRSEEKEKIEKNKKEN